VQRSGFGLTLFPGFPFCASLSAYRPLLPGAYGASQVLDASLLACQALGPRQTLGTLAMTRALCVGLRHVNTVAVCIDSFYEAEIASGWCVTPLAYKILCVRFAPVVHVCRSLSTTCTAPPEAQHSIRVGG